MLLPVTRVINVVRRDIKFSVKPFYQCIDPPYLAVGWTGSLFIGYYTNSYGLASPEIEVKRPTPNTLRIMIIGDAFSMPEGMEYEYAYPSLLENKLAGLVSGRTIQVINAGVTGYGPVEQYPQLLELAPIFTPDIVL